MVPKYLRLRVRGRDSLRTDRLLTFVDHKLSRRRDPRWTAQLQAGDGPRWPTNPYSHWWSLFRDRAHQQRVDLRRRNTYHRRNC